MDSARIQELETQKQDLADRLARLESTNFELRSQMSEFGSPAPPTHSGSSEDLPDEDAADSEQMYQKHANTCLQLCHFISDANSHLRSTIYNLFVAQRKLSLPLYSLTKAEQQLLGREIDTRKTFNHPIFDGVEMPFERWETVPSYLMDDWQAMTRGVTNMNPNYVTNIVETNMEIFEDVQSKFYLYNKCYPEIRDYIFDEEDSPQNLVLRKNGQIRLATLTKLIENLTHENRNDVNTRYVILLTHMSFTTSEVLLDYLRRRYEVPIPMNMTPTETKIFRKKKLARIQIKVFSVLKNWIEEHWKEDFAKNETLITQLKSWMKSLEQENAEPWTDVAAKHLLELIDKKKLKQERNVRVFSVAPKPLIAEGLTLETLDFMRLVEKEVARQITITDFAIFHKIQPRECLNKNWSHKTLKHELAPNIVDLTERFNKISSWVQVEILELDRISARSQMMRMLIRISEHLEQHGNFHAMFAIICGMNTTPIFRLKKTQEKLPSNTIQTLDRLRRLCHVEPNYKYLREALSKAASPCIPHLGIFLKDLTFIEDGNKDMINNMINFDKRRKLAERIQWIQQYQQAKYQLTLVQPIQDYLDMRMRAATEYTEDELWQKSLLVEPRE